MSLVGFKFLSGPPLDRQVITLVQPLRFSTLAGKCLPIILVAVTTHMSSIPGTFPFVIIIFFIAVQLPYNIMSASGLQRVGLIHLCVALWLPLWRKLTP